MAITSAICSSFKQEVLVGTHNFTASSGNSFKLALYTSSATLGAATTAFTTTGQASGTNYTSGGNALTSVTPVLSGTTAVCDFADLTFGTATVTARGCMIYNDTQSDKALLSSTLVVTRHLPLATSLLSFQAQQRLAQSFGWPNAKCHYQG